MTCEDCDQVTATRRVAAPIRVGSGNLDVYGCDLHVKELLGILAQAVDRGDAEVKA